MTERQELTPNDKYTEICQRLDKLSTPLICDALPNVRLMDSKIVAVGENNRCIGRAYTVDSHQDSLSIMHALDDLHSFLDFLNCSDNDVVPTIIIIDSNGSPYGLAGGMCATAAKFQGFGGIVIDGFCRDIQEIRDSEIPFFSRGICAKSGSKDKIGTIKEKIQCGGVDVNPGDLIFADEDGIVVMSKEEAVSAILKGEEKQKKEDVVLQKLKDGAAFNQICNINEHTENIQSGAPSKLKLIV